MDNPVVVSLRSIIDEEFGYPNIFFSLNLYPDPIDITKSIWCSQEKTIDNAGCGRMMDWLLDVEERRNAPQPW